MSKIIINAAKLRILLAEICRRLDDAGFSLSYADTLFSNAFAEEPEPSTGNKVVIRNYCQTACDCDTCHQGTNKGTQPENCVYCQVKWFGHGEYAKEQKIRSN